MISRCDITPSKDSLPPDGKTPDLPEGVPPLLSLQLYLSIGCNLKCRHCWVNSRHVTGMPDPKDLIDMELLRSAVAEAKTLGLFRAVLTGGEPMVHPHFREITEMLSSEGLSLCLVTNGTLINDRIAQWLKDSTRVSSICLSLDGSDAQIHDQFRGVPGAFDATLSGLDLLADAGHRNLQVICCVHRGNAHQADDLVALARDHGATSVKFTPLTNKGRGSELHSRQEGLSLEECIALEKHLRTELSDIEVFFSLFPPALLPLKELWRKGGIIGNCGVLTNLGILGTGEISLCGIGRTVPEMVFGRLGDSIREIWLNQSGLKELRRELLDVANYPGICRDCIHASTCMTGCVANNFVEGSRLVWPSFFCTEAEAKGLFPAKRRR
ncbi:MAG TPA: radical SAM protein [Methanotrichaceae archaeon]|nr:radical SAM protein [Methanotrichaceae archaeon]